MDFQVEPLDSPTISSSPPQPEIMHPPTPVQPPAPKPKKRFGPAWFFQSTERIILAGALIAILFLVGLFFLTGHNTFSQDAIQLEFEGVTEIGAGDQAAYILHIHNRSNVAVENVRISFFYPDDAVPIIDGNVANIRNSMQIIDLIKAEETIDLPFAAIIVGDKGDIKTAQAVITYRPVGLRSDFQSRAEWSTAISRLSVPIGLTVPPKILPDQQISYIIDYRNQSDETLENLRFLVTLPEGFQAIKFSPAPSKIDSFDIGINQRVWVIPSLAVSDGSRITIEGKLFGTASEVKKVSVELQKEFSFASDTQYVGFQKISADSSIIAPLLSLTGEINSEMSYVSHAGDILFYDIILKNTSETELTGLSLSTTLEGDMFDFSTVKSSGFFDSRTKTILWDASNVPELGLLDAMQEIRIPFNISLKPNLTAGQNPSLDAHVHVQTDDVPANLSADLLTAEATLTTSVSTNVTLSDILLWNDPAFGTLTPFPPQVDRKTIFTTEWRVSNPLNNISPARVTAVLEPGVVWEAKSSTQGGAPQPAFDPLKNTITWDLGIVRKEVGTSLPELQTYFQVSIIPSVHQVGEAVPLLRDIIFTGMDTVTGESIVQRRRDMNSSNVSDTEIKGIVQP